MSRKLVKYLITGLLIAGIALGAAYFWLGIFTPYNAFAAKRDISKGNIQILYYGEMDPNQKLVDRVAIQFGFHYTRVDDCTVNQVLINGVNQYNKVVNEYLDKSLGIDWDEKFNEKLNKLLDLDR